MPQSLSKYWAFARVILVVAGLAAGGDIAMAQTGDCAACVKASSCEQQRSDCVAQCRATLFSIDPRRTSCIASCTDAASSCKRSVEETCHAQNRCP